MDENKVKNDTAADGMQKPSGEVSDEKTPAESGELLRRLGELRGELEKMRGELAEVRSARRPAVDASEFSTGSFRGASDSLFSPAEVRAMSRAEVRENLERIRESMRHWS